MVFPSARQCMVGFVLLSGPMTAAAQMDGHGPDAWQVTGLAPEQSLDAYAGPGTDYLRVGAFPPDATGLQLTTCVPYLTMTQFLALSEAERDALPPRWCLVTSRDRQLSGWVPGRHLAEDGSYALQATDVSLVSEAVTLVRNLYVAYRESRDGANGPLQPSAAREFFFPDIVTALEEGDEEERLPSVLGQDMSESGIQPAPDRPMFRGMITIHALIDERTPSQPVIFRLRVDPSLDPPALRIMHMEHGELSFP